MSRASGKPKEDKEIARPLLQRLTDQDVMLRRVEGCYRLMRQSTQQAARVPESLISLCMRHDWLKRDGQDLVLSDAGRAWLRRDGDSADPFRQQHQVRATGLRDVEGVRRQVTVNETESPLGWLRSRKDRNGRPLITDAQYAAGERLRADYWFAGLSQRVTSNWSAPAPADRSRRAAPSHAASLRDDVIAAKERVARALKAVGPELSGVLIDVCCELKGLEEAERNEGWPQRAGKVVLQIALTRLARHYGIEPADRAAHRRMRHWGGEDYRPSLDARSTQEGQ